MAKKGAASSKTSETGRQRSSAERKKIATARKKDTSSRSTTHTKPVKTIAPKSKALRPPVSTVDAATRYLSYVYKNPEASYLFACKTLEKYRKEIMAIPGVVCAEVGIKQIGEFPVRIFAIRVLVTDKLKTAAAIRAARSKAIPTQFDAVPTDVIEVGTYKDAVAPGDPIISGGGRGTFGAFVRPFGTSRIRMITAAHVVGNGPSDLKDDTGQHVGTFTPTDKTHVLNETVDCALVQPLGQTVTELTDGNGIVASEFRDAIPAHLLSSGRVWKKGASTGVTTGTITVINSGRRPISGGTFAEHQVIIEGVSPGSPFALAGDSGAVVCIDDIAIGVVRAVSDQTAGQSNHETLVTPYAEILNSTLGELELR